MEKDLKSRKYNSPCKVPDHELSRITEASVSEYSNNENRNSYESNNVNQQQAPIKISENEEYDFLITKSDKNNQVSVNDSNILCDNCKCIKSEPTTAAETPNSESTVTTTVELEQPTTNPSSQVIEINSFKTFCYINNKGKLNINNIYLINNGHNNYNEIYARATTSLNEDCKNCSKSKVSNTKIEETSPKSMSSGSSTPCSPISPKFNIFQLDSGDELDQ